MLSLKTIGLDKHATGMSLHLGSFDTASYIFAGKPLQFFGEEADDGGGDEAGGHDGGEGD